MGSFSLIANAAADPFYAGLEEAGTSDSLSPFAAMGCIAFAAYVIVKSFSEVYDELEAEENAPTKKTVQPGWLTCDMRVPLPPYNELLSACHLLNTIDGERWWLCAEPDSYPQCTKSPDFSEYYQQSVFVCK